MTTETKKTRVFIYEDGKRLWGTITHTSKEFYIVAWDDGKETAEEIKDFDPVGWVQ